MPRRLRRCGIIPWLQNRRLRYPRCPSTHRPTEAVKHCRHRNGSVHDAWVPWKLLLQRTFGVNAMKCPACGSKLEVRAVVRGAWHAGKLLGVLGMPADASLPFARDGPA